MFTFVRGLVVESPARVVSANERGVVFQISKAQANALGHAETALVESPLHGASFRAEIESLDRARAQVSVSRLEPFDKYMERRQLSRVVPDHPMLVRVHTGENSVNGRVADISASALAADLDLRAVVKLQGARLVDLEVWGEERGPGALCDFETQGRLQRICEIEDVSGQACRAVIEMDAYPALDKTLRRYVARRQREILTELEVA